MIDDGQLSHRVSDGADPDQIWADEPLADSGDLFGAPPVDDGTPTSLDLTLPERIWGEEPADSRGAELEVSGDSPFADDWWLPEEGADPLVDEWLAVDPPPAADVDEPAVGASSVTTPAIPQAPRRPGLAPAPVPGGPRRALRRVVGGIQAAPRMAALALVVATAGLFVALVARGPDPTEDNGPQRIDAANLQPSSTMPAFTAPPAPSTSLTTLVTSPQPRSTGGEAPATTPVPPSPVATAPPSSVTTAAPRPTARPEPTVPPPARPPTVATPPPTTIVVEPEPEPEPDTTATTRRPRITVPETTVAPSTTVPTSTKPPPADD